MKHIIYFSLVIILLSACSTRIKTKINTSYPSIDFREAIVVIGINEKMPLSADTVGLVKINQSIYSSSCNLENALEDLKIEARKYGGNAIKIAKHKIVGTANGICHKMQAYILKVPETGLKPPIATAKDSILAQADYALFHIYRVSDYAMFFSYNLNLGDTVLYRIRSNDYTTIKIKKDGYNTLWAATEVKKEVPINVCMGKEYYIRCGVTSGIIMGRPKIEIVPNEVAKHEVALLNMYLHPYPDKIVLTNGRVIDCKIINEDSEKINILVMYNSYEKNTFIFKNEVKTIIKSE